MIQRISEITEDKVWQDLPAIPNTSPGQQSRKCKKHFNVLGWTENVSKRVTWCRGGGGEGVLNGAVFIVGVEDGWGTDICSYTFLSIISLMSSRFIPILKMSPSSCLHTHGWKLNLKRILLPAAKARPLHTCLGQRCPCSWTDPCSSASPELCAPPSYWCICVPGGPEPPSCSSKSDKIEMRMQQVWNKIFFCFWRVNDRYHLLFICAHSHVGNIRFKLLRLKEKIKMPLGVCSLKKILFKETGERTDTFCINWLMMSLSSAVILSPSLWTSSKWFDKNESSSFILSWSGFSPVCSQRLSETKKTHNSFTVNVEKRKWNKPSTAASCVFGLGSLFLFYNFHMTFFFFIVYIVHFFQDRIWPNFCQYFVLR